MAEVTGGNGSQAGLLPDYNEMHHYLMSLSPFCISLQLCTLRRMRGGKNSCRKMKREQNVGKNGTQDVCLKSLRWRE